MRPLCLLPLLLLGSCDPAAPPVKSLGNDEIPLVIEQLCPGDSNCPDSGDGKLYVGAAKRDITPLVEPFVDLPDKDGKYNGVHGFGEPFTDLNGNGVFDPVWIAGYGEGRQAFGVHDPNWVRCYVLKQNETTIAHCAVDVVGYFRDESQQMRADLDPKLGIDLLVMSATHVHETKDSIGIWGASATESGFDPEWMRWIRASTIAAITEAVGKLKPAKLAIASILVEDPGHDMTHYVSDTRDPVVIDNRLHLFQYDGEDGKPIVTVINWSAHPEAAGSKNRYISSDFVHYLRETVEKGTGSDVVYVSGSLGGQIGPGRVEPVTDDGKVIKDDGFPFIDAWGTSVGRFALKAFAARKEVASPKLAFRSASFNIHVENLFYHTAGILGLFKRQFFGFDKTKALVGENTPLIDTEVAYITLGPVAIITCPGELLPENFVGGYDGSYAGTWPFTKADSKGPVDLTKAPKPPYLIDLMQGEKEHRMVWGLTLDFVGYIVPRYDFILSEDAPYLNEAEGDHYEETNSVGPRAAPEIVGTMRQLIESAIPFAKPVSP
ncbi:MAG: hypothetical protein EXR72_14930 [Myxococcales bacterium]|nr:hypothetical protein [Myxococcales bacterium]